MKFVKGIMLGTIISAGVLMMYAEGNELMNKKKIMKKAEKKLEKDLQKSLKGGIILEKEFNTEKNGKNITVTIRAKCNKQIAVKQAIEEDTNGGDVD